MASHHDEEVSLFTSLTGTDAATADQFLSACGYNVEEVTTHPSRVGHDDNFTLTDRTP